MTAPHVLVVDLWADTAVEVGLAAHAILAAEPDATFGEIVTELDGRFSGTVLIRSTDFGPLAERLDAMGLPAITDFYASAEF